MSDTWQITVEREVLRFRHGGREAGVYCHGDPWKPWLHPLRTPAGWRVSLASPHDHRHHKGLMYALQTRRLNFWEEYAFDRAPAVGRQRNLGVVVAGEGPARAALRQELLWEPADGGPPSFREERSIACVREDDAFSWTWTTRLEVLADDELVQSPFSPALPDGRRVNYHGLGIRFRREFGGTGGNGLELDGVRGPIAQGLGTTPRRAAFLGSIDGHWPVPRVRVEIEPPAGHGLFVMEAPFAFMSFGPSNLGPVPLRAGAVLEETYRIRVADGWPQGHP